jgi:hypothetical protein
MWVLGIPFLLAVAVFVAGCVIAARALYAARASLNARQRLRVVTVFLAMTVFLAGFTNCTIFFMISAAIGGDAVAGKVEAGTYYVSSHGRLTEVSREVWEYSYAHAHITWATSTVATLALSVAALAGHLFWRERPAPLTITVRRDGELLVDGQRVGLPEVISRAEATRARGQEVYVHREYPPDAVPTGALALCHELVVRSILFQALDVAPGAGDGRVLGTVAREG